MKKIQAAVLTEFNKPLQMRSFNHPELRDKEILVRITASGVCGSDVHMWKGLDKRVSLPIILGHEGVGIIEEITEEKVDIFGKPLNIGDPIIWDRGVTCGKCLYCTVYKTPSLCTNRWTYGISKACIDPPCLNGCYSEAIVLDRRTNVIKLDEDTDPVTLVSASCSGATSAHSFKLHPPKIGEIALVQGPGPLGIFHVAFAREYGASEILVIGGTEKRLVMCKKFGATMIINRRETTLEEREKIIFDITEGRGVDVAYECSGSVNAFMEGLRHLRIGGTYVVPGFGVPSGEAMVDCYRFITRKNLKIQGVWVSDTSHLYQAVKLVQSKKYPFKEFVSHRLPLTEATEALRLVDERKAVKVVLLPF
ncbi:MAG: zinc-binding dehydrogenase [Candidatus Bathyarchaeia archaeon]